MNRRESLKTFVAVFTLMLSLTALSSGQVIVSNSKVTYTYQQSANNSYVPSSPLISEVPDSRLAFAPSSFGVQSSGAGMSIVSTNAVLTVDMRSSAGQWFIGNAVSLDLLGSYSLTAPFSTSEAFASVTGSYTLYLEEVDDVAFSSTTPMAGSVVFSPTNTFSIVGPGAVTNGSWSGSIVMSLNAIKTHFGIGATNNVTGLRLQYSQSMTAASINASATVNLLNANITNQVVPEPSTYALLVLAASGLGAFALRRRYR